MIASDSLPFVLATTARAGCPPVATEAPAPTTPLSRGLATIADLAGTLLLGLIFPVGILVVGLPVALAVRAVLYLLGQL